MGSCNSPAFCAPLPTPFDEEGALDLARLRAALPTWIRSPLTGFVVLGSNGEAGLMNDIEADRVDRDGTRGRCRADARSSSAPAASRRARRIAAAQARGRSRRRRRARPHAGLLQGTDDRRRVRASLHRRLPTRRRCRSCSTTSRRVTGVNLLPAAVARLATHPNIVGMKESGGDVAQIADLVSATPAGFSVLAGIGVDVLRGAVRRRRRRHSRARRASCPTRASGCSSWHEPARHDEARALQRAARCRSRGCSAPATACPD